MTSINEIDQVDFDTVIIGSSLSNCILFASLARAGKSVALFEPQPFHGWLNSTMFLSDFHRLIAFLQQTDAQRAEKATTSQPLPFFNILEPPMLSRRDRELISQTKLPTTFPQLIQAYQQRTIQQHTFLKSLLKPAPPPSTDPTSQGEAPEDDSNDEEEDQYGKLPSFTTFPADFNLCKYVKRADLTAELSPSASYTCIPFSTYLTSPHVVEATGTTQIVDNTDYNITLSTKFDANCSIPLHNGYEYIPTSNQPLKPTELSPLDLLATPPKPTESAPPNPVDPTDTTPCNPKLEEILKRNGYRYGIDIIPQQIYATSLTVKALIQAKFLDYFEFHALNRIMVLFKPGAGVDTVDKMIKVPVIDDQVVADLHDASAPKEQDTTTPLVTESTPIDDVSTAIEHQSATKENAEHAGIPAEEQFQEKQITEITNIDTLLSYKPWSVPSSKSQIFGDSMLSLRCKNKLSTLLLILLHDSTNAQTTQYHKDMYTTYADLPLINLVFHLCNPHSSSPSQLTSMASSILSTPTTPTTIEPITEIPDLENIDSDTLILTQLITYGLSQYLNAALTVSSLTKSTPTPSGSKPTKNSKPIASTFLSTSQAYNCVKTHISSIGRYGPSPMLYPSYGIGELAQAWVRNGCVWGGVAVHRIGIAGMLLPNTGVLSVEEFEPEASSLVKCESHQESATTTNEPVIPTIKLNGKSSEKDHIGILLQTGQVIKAKSVVLDRVHSPFPLSETTITSYSPSPTASDSLVDKPNMSESSGQVDLADELAYGTSIQLPSQLIPQTIPPSYCVSTTQHTVLITDSLPQHFLPQDPSECASLQIFVVPQHVQTSDKQSLSQFISDKLNALDKVDGSDVDATKLDISNGASKIFIADDTNNLTLRNQYMILITTNLASTAIQGETHEEIAETIDKTFISQRSLTSDYFNSRHSPLSSTQTTALEQFPHDLPQVLSVLPQLESFFPIDPNSHKITADHVIYIATYCHTFISPNYPQITKPATTTNYTTTTTASRSNIFITADPNPLDPSPDQAFHVATHTYYGLMGHFFTTLKKTVLPFLMTIREQVDGDNGEVLERLEDRNPHLAHTIDVMDNLERQLESLDNDKTDATTGSDVSNDQNVNSPSDDLNESDVQSPRDAEPDDEANEEAILASLDNLDVGDLLGLQF